MNFDDFLWQPKSGYTYIRNFTEHSDILLKGYIDDLKIAAERAEHKHFPREGQGFLHIDDIDDVRGIIYFGSVAIALERQPSGTWLGKIFARLDRRAHVPVGDLYYVYDRFDISGPIGEEMCKSDNVRELNTPADYVDLMACWGELTPQEFTDVQYPAMGVRITGNQEDCVHVFLHPSLEALKPRV